MFIKSIKLLTFLLRLVHIHCTQSSEELFYYTASSSLRWCLWFIKLISVRSIKLSSSQIRENCFCFASPSPAFNLCIWLSALLFLCCIFIANANELVGKSCVIKFYFQWSEIQARNAMFFLGKRCTRCWDGKEVDNAFCASLSPALLPKFTFLLWRCFWLIIFQHSPIISPCEPESHSYTHHGCSTWCNFSSRTQKMWTLMRLWERCKETCCLSIIRFPLAVQRMRFSGKTWMQRGNLLVIIECRSVMVIEECHISRVQPSKFLFIREFCTDFPIKCCTQIMFFPELTEPKNLQNLCVQYFLRKPPKTLIRFAYNVFDDYPSNFPS